jgi:hypothetical protein
MNDAPTIDGKQQLITYLESLHPNGEYPLKDLPRILPSGFTVTDNPQGFSILNPDPTRSTLFGPFGDRGVTLPLHQGTHGLYVKGLDLLVAIARVVEVGPPVWARSADVIGNWWKAQIATCAPFTAPATGPLSREDMEKFVDADPACKLVMPMFIESVNAGSGSVTDSMLREFIERAGADVAAAIQFYTAQRNGRLGIAPAPKPRRAKAASQEVGV